MELKEYLNDLKLNSYEKEIIFYLASVDSAGAKSIYKNTKVPKGRIYSVLQELSKAGFVAVIPTSPKKYQIKDIKESLRNYLDDKQTQLKDKAQQVDNIQISPKVYIQDTKEPSVQFFTGRDEHIGAVVALRNKAEKELLQMAPRFQGNFASKLSLQKVLQRGVKVKVIVSGVTELNKKSIQNCLKYGGEVKVYEADSWFAMMIKDSEELLISLQNREKNEERLTTITQSEPLILAMRNLFLQFWKKAKPIKKV